MANKNEYYDIEFDLDELLSGGLLDEYFHLQDLRQRKLYIDGPIVQDCVSDITRHILQYNKEDAGIEPEKRKPILLYLVSNGGHQDAGFQLIDVIMSSVTPVYTINLGYQYSMGFLIGLAGHKRFATKNAKYLLHDGSTMLYNSGTKVYDQVMFEREVENRVKQYVLSRSNLTDDEYDSKLRVEWYMFADEAKKRGFVDYIIGVDCGIGEVI